MSRNDWYIDYQTTIMDLDNSIVSSRDREFDKEQVDNILRTMTKIVNKRLKDLCKREEIKFRPNYENLEFELRLEGDYHHDSNGSLMCYTCVFGAGLDDKREFILNEIEKAVNGSQSLKDLGLIDFIYEFTG